MAAFTLRLEPKLAKTFQQVCQKKGFSKTGLIVSLIRDFINQNEAPPQKPKPSSLFYGLVGVVHLGGDALKDSEALYDE